MNKPKISIFVEDSFDSAHSLPHLPKEHKCHNLHGHTYRIRIEVSGPVSKRNGWIVDYGVVKSHWSLLKDQLDHQFLNAIIPVSTCENLAAWIASELQQRFVVFGPPSVRVSAIELRETERCGVRLEVA